jgi:hypothetical protein
VKARALLAALAVAGCTTPMIQVQRRPDGILHFTCKTALTECLAAAEKACERQRYAVLRAFDDHNFKGDVSFPEDFRSSEAFVRCDSPAGWSGENRALREHPVDAAVPAASAAPASSSTPARACVPGATQACVGPGGCAGGQACAMDGAAFGACDCGAPKPQ